MMNTVHRAELTAWLLKHGDNVEIPRGTMMRTDVHGYALVDNGYLIDLNYRSFALPYCLHLTPKGRALMESEDESVPD